MRQLAIEVRAVMVAADTYRRAMAAALGVGVTEVSALGEIRQDGPLTPSELARRLGLTSPSVTSLLDRLETAGLVARRRHPADRRSVLVELTASGDELLVAAFEQFSDDVATAVRSASPEHVRELGELLGGVAGALRARAGDRDGLTVGLARHLAGRSRSAEDAAEGNSGQAE
ncbi:MAG TPA: MarR family transcriptional regulator [Pseudonocardia sp.]|jgi:DNA-binding MarR family transcriptional regulator|nr:MarR family transcriptional regulator [Pseudonocardia sp.]